MKKSASNENVYTDWAVHGMLGFQLSIRTYISRIFIFGSVEIVSVPLLTLILTLAVHSCILPMPTQLADRMDNRHSFDAGRRLLRAEMPTCSESTV